MSLKLIIFLKQFALKRKRIWRELKGRVSVLLTSPNTAAVYTLNTPKAHKFIFLQSAWRKQNGNKWMQAAEPAQRCGCAGEPHFASAGRNLPGPWHRPASLQLLHHLHFLCHSNKQQSHCWQQTCYYLVTFFFFLGQCTQLLVFKVPEQQTQREPWSSPCKDNCWFFPLFLKGILPKDGLGS